MVDDIVDPQAPMHGCFGIERRGAAAVVCYITHAVLSGAAIERENWELDACW